MRDRPLVIAITGANSGIGSAAAARLAASGASLVLNDSSVDLATDVRIGR